MRVAELLDRAMAASQGGRGEEARDLLVDVLALEPGNLEAWLRLAELAASPERAALYYQRAAALDPRSLRAQRGLEETQARLQPLQERERVLPSTTPPQEERAVPPRPAPVSPAALPPDARIFVDSEAAPFTLEPGEAPGLGRAKPPGGSQSTPAGGQGEAGEGGPAPPGAEAAHLGDRRP